MEKPAQRLRILLPAAVCTFLWGSAFPFIKLGYAAFAVEGPFSQILFAGLRFALAGLLLLAVLTVRGRRVPVPPKGSRLSVLRLGLVLTAGQYFFFYLGLANTTGVRGSIIQGMGTFLTVVLAHFWFHGKDGDRMTGRKALGCIVGLLGVVLANFEGTQGGFSFSGEGLMLLATVLFAVGSLFSKDVTKTVDPFCATGWQLLLGGLVLTLIGLLGGGRLCAPASFSGWGIFLYLAALSSVAFAIWTRLLQKFAAGRVAVYNFLTPLFGVLLSACLLGESLSGVQIVLALLLVCLGIVLVNLPARRVLSAP